MQVKVQTVNELTINQLSEDQYKAEKAAGRINAGEVYACTPSPVKWEDIQGKPDVSGGSVNYQELARRIPTWQWKVTMPKTANQTVTATIGSKTYTSDFYAQQGSQIAFSAKAYTGYTAGDLSIVNATLSKDLIVTITSAIESGEVGAVTKTFNDRCYFTVPPEAQVLKWTWAGKDTYTKVTPGDGISINVTWAYDYAPDGALERRRYYAELSYEGNSKDSVFFTESDAPLTASWSTEINKHAVDYDWTK